MKKLTSFFSRLAGTVIQAAPAGTVAGALIFYSGGSKIKYFLLGVYVWLIEALRYLKYLPLEKKGKNKIMFDTSLNVMHSVFTSATTKEIFERYYNSIAG